MQGENYGRPFFGANSRLWSPNGRRIAAATTLQASLAVLGVRIPTSVILFECAVLGEHGVGKLRIHVDDESPPGFRIIVLQCARRR
jgi:hypothetical protein